METFRGILGATGVVALTGVGSHCDMIATVEIERST
jgi:hypothetical protein